jgi:hypothetical protein
MAAVQANEIKAILVLPKKIMCSQSWKIMHEKYEGVSIISGTNAGICTAVVVA